MENEEIEDDVYVQQLREVFNSCDLDDKGYLNRNELIDLSQKLKLNDQVPALLKEILGDKFSDGKVSFESFHDGFVKVLAMTIDTIDEEDDDPSDWSDIGDVLSRSNSVISKRGFTPADGYVDVFSHDSVMSPQNSDKNVYTRKTSTPHDAQKQRPISNLRLLSKNEAVIEGNGTMEPVLLRKLATDTPDLISNMDAQELHKIWDDIAVGESGFLNLLQLSTVCDHIGMEGLEDNELELLFTELDTNKDGLISFHEFYDGLFKNPSLMDLNGDSDDDGDLESTKSACSIKSLKEIVRENGCGPQTNGKNSQIKESNKLNPIDIFSFLDEEDSGYVELQKIKTYVAKHLCDLNGIIYDLKPNSEGKIHLKQLSHLLEKTVYESNETICKSVLETYKKEMVYLHDQLDTSKSDVTILKNNILKLGSDNKTLVRESEEQMKNYEMKSKAKLRDLTETFEKKIATQEENIKDRDSVIEKHEIEKKLFDEKLENMKNDDLKMKCKLKEMTSEILRLEKNLKETIDQLNEERKKRSDFEKDFEDKRCLRTKISDLEREVTSLSKIRDAESRLVEDLKQVNKELRDRIDEFEHTQDNQRPHKSSPDNINRLGSYLSDYLKPEVTQRFSQGESCDDVFPNADMDELRIKVIEQETTITALRRDLETVNRLLEESTTDASERHRREINRITDKYASEISDLQNMLAVERNEMVKHYSKDKNVLIESYEMKLREMQQNFQNERESILKDRDSERDRWETSSEADRSGDYSFRKDRRRIEMSFREEKEELELNYRSEITKLEEKVVILETEKAEMELTFLNEKAELEQKFRIERAELQRNANTTTREYDKSQKYIDFLKEDLNKKHEHEIEEITRNHKKEKENMLDNMENELDDLTKKHQRELNEMKRMLSHQVSELEKCFSQEKASIREGFNREKTELEQTFTREKAELMDVLKQEYEHELAKQLAHLRKISMEERSSIEKELRMEKTALARNLQQEKTQAELFLKQQKTNMEVVFAEEKAKMNECFELEKTQIENKYMQEISELQQAFSGGEAGLKGKMKEDFHMMVNRYKKECELSYGKEKLQLQESYAREKAELELSWQVEKTAMEEDFISEKLSMEENFDLERRELVNKLQKQKERIEEEFQQQIESLRTNRDEEFAYKLQRETCHLQNSVNHFESELLLLKEQKKELETQNQILELKSLSQKQEAVEINEFKCQKKAIDQKMVNFQEEIVSLKRTKEGVESELNILREEKATILDNSVQEITQQQQRIIHLESENYEKETKIEELLKIKLEKDKLKHEYMIILEDNEVKDSALKKLKEVEERNAILTDNVRSFEMNEYQLHATLSEKETELAELQKNLSSHKTKWEDLENAYNVEMRRLDEKLNIQNANFATEKSRCQREIHDLKEQLHRASVSSDRDNALKEKVFNDAKAEVMHLNKKLEEKSRKIRSLEESLKLFDEKLYTATEQQNSYEEQIHNLKIMLNENKMTAREEKKDITSKSIRSDVLVTDLYLENADLMKHVALAESNQLKAEKQVRQLTEQKRALQRVISKLCHANGITNIT